MPNGIDWRVREPRDSLGYCNKHNTKRVRQTSYQLSQSLCNNKKS